MAITINWPTGVISIPKADMTLLQSFGQSLYVSVRDITHLGLTAPL